jgi:hypothetical protein
MDKGVVPPRVVIEGDRRDLLRGRGRRRRRRSGLLRLLLLLLLRGRGCLGRLLLLWLLLLQLLQVLLGGSYLGLCIYNDCKDGKSQGSGIANNRVLLPLLCRGRIHEVT